MRQTIPLAVIAAIIAAVIVNDTRAKRSATDCVDDVCIRYTGGLEAHSVKTLAEAEKVIVKALDRIMLLPCKSQKKALELIRNELRVAASTQSTIDEFKSEFKEPHHDSGNKEYINLRLKSFNDDLMKDNARAKEFKNTLHSLRASM